MSELMFLSGQELSLVESKAGISPTAMLLGGSLRSLALGRDDIGALGMT